MYKKKQIFTNETYIYLFIFLQLFGLGPLRCLPPGQIVHLVGSVLAEHIRQVASQLVHAVEFAKI